MRPVLIVLELAPVTLRKKDDNKTREIQNLRKSSQYPLPRGGKGGLSKMVGVPEGENSQVYALQDMNPQPTHAVFHNHHIS